MATVAPSLPIAPCRFSLPAPLLTAIVLAVAAVLLRAPSFGDPAISSDEQFYLLVGDRMLHGAILYVDIWDRKPIGLFLIYAAIRLLGGDGIVQYQLVATLFAVAAAWTISRIARRIAPEPAAMAAGLAYLLWIETIEGGGGQSPVFYNPLVAAAALATLAAIEAEGDRAFLRRGFLAMTAGGIAIQIKYTALFEVAFFGLALTGSLLRRTSLLRSAGWSAALGAMALAPTGLALTFYAAIGHLHDFWFANFTSIGLRLPGADGQSSRRLAISLKHLAPVAACCAASVWSLRRSTDRDRRWLLFLGGWIGAAAVGFASVGVFYFHYMLPLYVPLAAGIGPIVGRGAIGIGFAAIALWPPLANAMTDARPTAQNRAEIAHMLALLPPDVASRCLYEYDGPSILYHLSGACTLSRFVFPDHLSSRIERDAIGIDTRAEVARILARGPAAITVGQRPGIVLNQGTSAMLVEALARSYRPVGTGRIDGQLFTVYVRR